MDFVLNTADFNEWIFSKIVSKHSPKSNIWLSQAQRTECFIHQLLQIYAKSSHQKARFQFQK